VQQVMPGRLVSPVFFDMLFALHMCQDFNITLFVVLFGQCLPWQRHCVLWVGHTLCLHSGIQGIVHGCLGGRAHWRVAAGRRTPQHLARAALEGDAIHDTVAADQLSFMLVFCLLKHP
jgi:hypothetical protein